MTADLRLVAEGRTCELWAGDGVVLKRAAGDLPWLEPASAFFGGRGLVPPYVPLVHHEAAALRRVAPGRLVEAGVWRGRASITLRPVAGRPLAPGDDPERLLHELARALHELHAAGVVHRALAPDTVLATKAGITWTDLTLGLIDGLGAPGVVAAAPFRAPELDEGAAGDARSDLYALGALVAWLAGGGDRLVPVSRCPHPSVVGALLSPDPAGRPASAAELLAALGESAPEPARPPAHPAMASWARGDWAVDALAAHELRAVVEECARRPDTEADDVAHVAGRLLAMAPPAGPMAWAHLAALCHLLARTGRGVAEAQAREALDRAAAPALPVVIATRRVLEGVAGVDDFGTAGLWPLAARLGLDAGAWARDVTAASPEEARALPPARGLDWVRARVRAGDVAATRALELPGLWGRRAALACQLREDDPTAIATARELAAAGWWDPLVAGVHAQGDDEALRAAAARVLATTEPEPRLRARVDLAADLIVRIAAGELDAAVALAEAAVARAPDDAGMWAHLASLRLAQGESGRAHDALARAIALDPDRPAVLLATARLAFADGRVGDGEHALDAARRAGVPEDLLHRAVPR